MIITYWLSTKAVDLQFTDHPLRFLWSESFCEWEASCVMDIEAADLIFSTDSIFNHFRCETLLLNTVLCSRFKCIDFDDVLCLSNVEISFIATFFYCYLLPQLIKRIVYTIFICITPFSFLCAFVNYPLKRALWQRWVGVHVCLYIGRSVRYFQLKKHWIDLTKSAHSNHLQSHISHWFTSTKVLIGIWQSENLPEF